MIVDVRTYTLVPRKMPSFLDKFEKLALPLVKRHGFDLMGFYTSQIGALNQVVHLWRYDSLADLEKKRDARDADPAWAEYLAATEGLVMHQENKIMRPMPYSTKA